MNKSTTSKLGLGAIIAVVLYLIASALTGGEILNIVDNLGLGDERATEREVAGERLPVPDWYEIYFTDPSCGADAPLEGGLDETIAADIRTAETSIDIAVFQLNAEPIVNALIEQEAAGVRVRVVTDSDYGDESAINRLRRHGTSVIEDKRSGLMHNKFVVIDEQVVWTGSLNFTSNGVYCNNNNVVRMVSAELAANYSVEMDEMYEDLRFGPRSPQNTPHPALSIEGVAVETYFASDQEVAPIVAGAVNRAADEILFMAFSLTEPEIGAALLLAAEEGVEVRGVFESLGAESNFSFYGDLRDAKLPNLVVRLDGNGHFMHHKVIIIDQEIVIFGSYNFTSGADDSNDENLLIIHDPVFASFFTEEFGFIWEEAAR